MPERIINLKDGSTAVFENECRNTRYGFAHISELLILFKNENRVIRTIYTAHYLNRTWEAYTFQSAMRSAVYTLVKARKDDLREAFKKERGYKKLTAKRAEEFAESIKNDYKLSAYREIMDALNYQYQHGGYSHPAAAECF